MGTRDPREPETGQMGLAGQPPAFVSPVLWVAQPWSCIWGFIGRKQRPSLESLMKTIQT